ncbi:MAG: 50S ribosomal protein L13 [Planctomycetes bacterium]|nr:50S ribosomal protein L13 [Planctomycetota bacterium]NOG54784.1 50S ribosomal protein L13 [Planctomycetota bacterium]
MRRETFLAKPGQVERKWLIADAEGQILGRMATQIATVLMGKHKPTYTPHVDCGDYVIVTNAAKVAMTGRKGEQKFKKSFSGYPGGLRLRTFDEIREKHPERLVEDAVRRMLPKGPLGRDMYRKLKVYAGTDHPHTAQQPETLEL